jgi:isovaleryl-CoA dehydrogenase
MGLLGLTASEEYGGLGKSYLDHVLVMEEVSWLEYRSNSVRGL